MKILLGVHSIFQVIYSKNGLHPVADLHGKILDARLPPVQILSISCNFWENLSKSYVGAPLESWHPTSGKSWIRHWQPPLSGALTSKPNVNGPLEVYFCNSVCLVCEYQVSRCCSFQLMSYFILKLLQGYVDLSVISLEPLILKSLLSWVSKPVWVTHLRSSYYY